MIAHRTAAPASPTQLRPDQHAWLAELYEVNYAMVYRVCSRLLRNPDDAADAVQDVFLTAAGSLQTDTTPVVARAWLVTVARNHCVDLIRRRARLGKAIFRLGPETSPAADVEATVATRDLVAGVLRQLSHRERQALWQTAVEHRSVADLAEHLRLSYMAAAQVIHRARRHAMEMAARVAAVIGLLRLVRDRRLHLGLQPLAAVAAVPLVVVAIHSSSSLPNAPDAPATIARIGAASGTAGPTGSAATRLPSGGAGAIAPPARAAIRGLVIPLPTAQTTVNAAAGQVGKIVPAGLASTVPQVIPLSTPSLPAVSAPLPTPSLPPVSLSPVPTP